MSIRVALILVLLARVAAADPVEEKSPDTALALSLGGTAASVGMVVVGIEQHNGELATVGVLSSLVTPSFGHWYSDHYLTAGLGIRVASATAFTVGLAQALACIDGCAAGHHDDGAALLGLGLIGYGVGTVWDIATAPTAAHDYNNAHRIAVMPTVLMPPSGPVMGIGVGGKF